MSTTTGTWVTPEEAAIRTGLAHSGETAWARFPKARVSTSPKLMDLAWFIEYTD